MLHCVLAKHSLNENYLSDIYLHKLFMKWDAFNLELATKINSGRQLWLLNELYKKSIM